MTLITVIITHCTAQLRKASIVYMAFTESSKNDTTLTCISLLTYLLAYLIIAAIYGIYRTVGMVNRLERRSVTCDNAQLPMLSEPCSCWPVAASMGSGH